ncbi:MAG: GTP-binding protein [Candidatus Lokiarchaeota archaeon]|nr:GTP-binding protein [Candidatus Lokiarchaeota archaeon]
MSLCGKIVIIGNAGVGKTSILARYVDDIFKEEYLQTIGANFLIKEIEISSLISNLKINKKRKKELLEKGFKLYFWDIGGQTDKLFANEYYFIQAVGAMVVFNVADKQSFEDLDFWISKMKELSGDIPFVLLGNQTDLTHRQVKKLEIEEKIEDLGVEYFETSAKLNKNIDQAFESLSCQVIKNFIIEKED